MVPLLPESRNSAFQDFDFGGLIVPHTEDKVILVNAHNSPDQPAGRHHAVAFFKGLDHFLGLLLPFLLRTDKKEIKQNEDKNKRRKTQERVHFLGWRCG